MRRIILSISVVLSVFSGVYAATPKESMRKTVDKALELSLEQSMAMYSEMQNHPGRLPKSIKDGRLETSTAHWWTSGFFPGTLWYLYENFRDESVRNAAEEMTARVSSEQFTTDNHDVGFQINCSFGNGYRLTGKDEYRTALINAGNSLATRFSPTVGCTKSWDRWNYPVIIDNMMNLELLTVSSALSGGLEHYRMAKSHADKTLECHFRPDGSSWHVVDYNPEDGSVVMRKTHQGAGDESAWSRGQAWGLYGYTMMYRQTRDSRYLDHAVKIGRFIMNHPNMPKDKVPYWDFDAPGIPNTARDASAAAVMASAFVELSTYTAGELADSLLTVAEQQIKSLASSAYSARKGRNCNFILMHSTGYFAKKSELDAPLSYADYYFVEALTRYRRLLDGRPVVDVCTVASENGDRQAWISAIERIAKPLLENMSNATLRKNMPVESNHADISSRHYVTHLEAFGRLLTGMAPWLELGADESIEGQVRAKYIDLVIKSLKNGVNPQSPDYLNFTGDRQPLVDAAFLAHGLLRARTQIWDRLDADTQKRVIRELESTRAIKPLESNWLLFSAMVECAIREFGGEWKFEAVRYALDKHSEWYKGDAWYGDGPNFHFDYYNSFVIQPMMVEVLDIVSKYSDEYNGLKSSQEKRYARYGEQLERLISPEGTFPGIGRSIAYRFGAFHALSDVAYRHILPASLSPAQVRCGMTELIRRQISVPGTFDENGWLTIGFCGHQPSVGERYISTGSLYLCSAAFIALGLAADDEFWSAPAEDWTQKKIWKGIDIKCDKALKG